MKDTLEREFDAIDEHISKFNGMPPGLCSFLHKENPVSKYCRLREMGLDKKEARVLMKIYEDFYYLPLLRRLGI